MVAYYESRQNKLARVWLKEKKIEKYIKECSFSNIEKKNKSIWYFYL